jgi:hypothetical protein
MTNEEFSIEISSERKGACAEDGGCLDCMLELVWGIEVKIEKSMGIR